MMATNLPRTLCPSCGQPMSEPIEQPILDHVLILEHCENPTCPLEDATLTRGEHQKLSPEKIAAYGAAKYPRSAR